MVTAKNFRPLYVQMTLYTPGAQFRPAKALAYLLDTLGSRLDGEPVVLPTVPSLPPEFPHLILKSVDGKTRLQAAPARIDMIQEDDELTDGGVDEFLDWATTAGLDYIKSAGAVAGRVAYVMRRVAPDANPAVTLARHFCQERWLGPHDALNRPTDFELHSHKRYTPPDLFELNSWMRIKTVILIQPGVDAKRPTHIMAEQDLNTPAEVAETREMSDVEIATFFVTAPTEMRGVLDLYFPGG